MKQRPSGCGQQWREKPHDHHGENEIILILIAIIVAGAMAWLALWYGQRFSKFDGLALLAGVVLAAGAGSAAIFYAFAGWQWFAAAQQAKVINSEYGTHYTQEEVFYASDVIDTIRQIDRKRIEVNGDLFRDKKDEK